MQLRPATEDEAERDAGRSCGGGGYVGSSREIPPHDIPKSHTFVLFNLPPHPPRALCGKHFRVMFDDKGLIELCAFTGCRPGGPEQQSTGEHPLLLCTEGSWNKKKKRGGRQGEKMREMIDIPFLSRFTQVTKFLSLFLHLFLCL